MLLDLDTHSIYTPQRRKWAPWRADAPVPTMVSLESAKMSEIVFLNDPQNAIKWHFIMSAIVSFSSSWP